MQTIAVGIERNEDLEEMKEENKIFRSTRPGRKPARKLAPQRRSLAIERWKKEGSEVLTLCGRSTKGQIIDNEVLRQDPVWMLSPQGTDQKIPRQRPRTKTQSQ